MIIKGEGFSCFSTQSQNTHTHDTVRERRRKRRGEEKKEEKRKKKKEEEEKLSLVD